MCCYQLQTSSLLGLRAPEVAPLEQTHTNTEFKPSSTSLYTNELLPPSPSWYTEWLQVYEIVTLDVTISNLAEWYVGLLLKGHTTLTSDTR